MIPIKPKIDDKEIVIPRKLAAVFKRNKFKYHSIAKELKVNVYWIYQYITKGKEPTNTVTRARMFLPKLRKKHDGRSRFTELAPHIQWWRKLKKEERNQWVKSAFDQVTDYQRTDEVQGEYITAPNGAKKRTK